MLGLFDSRLTILLGGSPDCGAVDGIGSGLVCAAVGCRFAVVVAAAATVDCGGEAERGGAGEVVGGGHGYCCCWWRFGGGFGGVVVDFLRGLEVGLSEMEV